MGLDVDARGDSMLKLYHNSIERKAGAANRFQRCSYMYRIYCSGGDKPERDPYLKIRKLYALDPLLPSNTLNMPECDSKSHSGMAWPSYDSRL